MKALLAILVPLCSIAWGEPCAATPSPAEELTFQAVRHAHHNDLALARARLTQAITLDPTYAPAYVTLAQVRERMGDYGEALRIYGAGLERIPRFVEGYRARAALFERLGRYDEATSDLLSASGITPNDAAIRRECAEFFVRRRAWSAALQQTRALQLLVQSNEDPPRCRKARARTLALQVLAGDSDPVRAHIAHSTWERRAIASVAGRFGAIGQSGEDIHNR